MNIIQISEQLKGVPDAYLGQLSKNPGQLPPYLVAAEMGRRQTMRKAYQDEAAQAQTANPMNRKSVMEEMSEKFQAQGPGAMPGQEQQQQPQAQQMAPNAPQRMAGGGLAALRRADGTPDEYEEYAATVGGPQVGGAGIAAIPDWIANNTMEWMPGKPQVGSPVATTLAELNAMGGEKPKLAAIMAELQGARGKQRLEPEIAALAAREAEYRNKKPSLGSILMQMGLGMAASKRPDFAGAVGEAGLGALGGYQAEKQRNEAQANAALGSRLTALQQMQTSDDALFREASQGFNTASSNWQHGVGALQQGRVSGENNRAAMERQTGELTAAEKRQAALLASQANEGSLNRTSQADIHAADRAATAAMHRDDMAVRERMNREDNWTRLRERQLMESTARGGLTQTNHEANTILGMVKNLNSEINQLKIGKKDPMNMSNSEYQRIADEQIKEKESELKEYKSRFDQLMQIPKTEKPPVETVTDKDLLELQRRRDEEQRKRGGASRGSAPAPGAAPANGQAPSLGELGGNIGAYGLRNMPILPVPGTTYKNLRSGIELLTGK